LWHAIDRRTGQVLAYVFGRRNDESFLQLKLLEPFGIKSSVLMDGVPTKDIYQRKWKWVNGRLKGLSANIFDSELESSDLPVGLFVFQI